MARLRGPFSEQKPGQASGGCESIEVKNAAELSTIVRDGADGAKG